MPAFSPFSSRFSGGASPAIRSATGPAGVDFASPSHELAMKLTTRRSAEANRTPEGTAGGGMTAVNPALADRVATNAAQNREAAALQPVPVWNSGGDL